MAVFFDVEKGYDITWKYGIMRDLNDFGLKGRLLDFIDIFYQIEILESVLELPFLFSRSERRGSTEHHSYN